MTINLSTANINFLQEANMDNRSERLVVPEGGSRVRIPPEIKSRMIQDGLEIIPLSIRPTINLPDKKRVKFWNDWAEMYPDHDSLANRFAEIGIFRGFFLPDTMGKLSNEQTKILARFNEEKKDRGFFAVEGHAMDIVMILSETGEDLLGNRYTRTRTVHEGSRIHVGGNGPSVRILEPNHISENVGIAPIVIPF